MSIDETLDWRIWSKNDLVEERTYLRAKNELPEMESAKQLREIIKSIDDKESVLDVGCASGHYLRSIRYLSNNCKYVGVDATEKYINFAREVFQDDDNSNFLLEDIYELNQKADIVFCCNVLLHLPSIEKPLKNLLNAANKKLLIRTLLSETTHFSKHLYTDDFDSFGNPTNFSFQNTYSFNYIENLINQYKPEANIKFINDSFNSKKLDEEGAKWTERQGPGTTRVIDNLQIAGNKVFKWAWVVCNFES